MIFLQNHLKVTAECHVFVVPTITFSNLFVFEVNSHDSRLFRQPELEHPTVTGTRSQTSSLSQEQPVVVAITMSVRATRACSDAPTDRSSDPHLVGTRAVAQSATAISPRIHGRMARTIIGEPQ